MVTSAGAAFFHPARFVIQRSMGDRTAGPDPCWHTYPDTVIELGDPVSLRVDLRVLPGPEQTRALRRLGLGRSFAIVTACNPRGRRLSTEENERRTGQLRAHVEREGIASVRADGVSPDDAHRERGLALAVARDVAIRIAAAYGQSAIFWFDGHRFSIVPALEQDAAVVRLPLDRSSRRPAS